MNDLAPGPLSIHKYETSVKPEDECPPFLVYDGLGLNNTVPRNRARKIVRAILERIYSDYCPEEYIKMVVKSLRMIPIALRPFIYHKPDKRKEFTIRSAEKNRIFLVSITAMRYIILIKEAMLKHRSRVPVIKNELDKTGLFTKGKVREFSERHILKIHDKGLCHLFQACMRTACPQANRSIPMFSL